MAKKGGSEAEFLAMARAQREAGSALGMVMNHPPKGQGKSLEEMLAAENSTPSEVPAFLANQSEAPEPDAVEKGAAKSVPQAFNGASGVLEVDIQLLHISPYQVRSTTDTECIDTLAESIQKSGLISPVVVRTLESSASYEIIAGHHRVEACRRLGFGKIPVLIKTMSDAEAACALASDNFVRAELREYERFKHAKMLIEHGFCKTRAEAATTLGVSRQLIGFLMSFDGFPESAKAVLELNPGLLGATAANDLKDIAREQPNLFAEALERVADGRLKQNQIRAWIQTKQGPTRLRAPKQAYLIRNDSGDVKITATEKGVVIAGSAIDPAKVMELIKANLDALSV